jgi:phosphatidylserine/phosphatidylglycerophosphate/cardiolipin synthase-like enzyme
MCKSCIAAVLAVFALAAAAPAQAWPKKKSLFVQAVEAVESRHSYQVSAAGSIEVAFSPNEGSEALVLKVIDSAKTELRVLSYSFTSAPITAALLRAAKRGVDVQLVADRKNNAVEDKSGKARAALSALANAGVDVRLISVYPIHHDKVVVADRDTVELGSFNYSDAAARRNSENVLVNWHNPGLAKVYLEHFERNHRQAEPYREAY